MVRPAVPPPLPPRPRAEPFAAQLALARVHSRLVPVLRAADGQGLTPEVPRGWFELPEGRGLAGYGLARALRLLLDVLAGLSALHDTLREDGEPFVHGEVVPALLRVDRLGVARLIPLAPWHDGAADKAPAPERWGHLAPERLLGDAIDQRADVFSIGVLLWEALAGRRLFESESIDAIVMRLMGGKVTLPELPPELAWAVPLKAVAMSALSVDPEQRFASCAELSAAIEAVAGDLVATHAEVAAFFRAPEPAPRPPPLSPWPSGAPSHHSSLSALVSPVRHADALAGPPSLAPELRAASAPPRRASWRPWAVAGVLCVLAVSSAVLITRYPTLRMALPGAAREGAPPSRQSAPVMPSSAAPSLTTAPSPSAAPPIEAPPVANEEAPAEPATGPHARPPKSVKALRRPPSNPAPKLKAPAKAVPAPVPMQAHDKDADQYGI